ncbi:MAG: GNAT family N-acetyltransferase [Spirulina sp. SIO3F2]|nr:GNAT family N-acetyltransferase [Spirulina sp. SIO3F2]
MTQSTLATPTPSRTADVCVRPAAIADIPVLAQIVYESLLPPLNHCFWDDLLVETQTETLQFIAAMLQADASNWGSFADFWVVEVAGDVLAGAVGYTPNNVDYRPLDLTRLDAIAQRLDWSAATTAAFQSRYEQLWQLDPTPVFLAPQAPWIIETVAVLPAARGQGLGKVLLKALLEEGRSRHHSHAGIRIINGNDRAQTVYERLGFKPYQTFHADYFEEQIPGITMLRLRLN